MTYYSQGGVGISWGSGDIKLTLITEDGTAVLGDAAAAASSHRAVDVTAAIISTYCPARRSILKLQLVVFLWSLSLSVNTLVE
jgi:hypothetical protein